MCGPHLFSLSCCSNSLLDDSFPVDVMKKNRDIYTEEGRAILLQCNYFAVQRILDTYGGLSVGCPQEKANRQCLSVLI